MELHKFISDNRKKIGLTQGQLGRAAGMPQCFVSRVEKSADNKVLQDVQRFAALVKSFGYRLQVVDQTGAVILPDVVGE